MSAVTKKEKGYNRVRHTHTFVEGYYEMNIFVKMNEIEKEKEEAYMRDSQ